MASVKKRPDGQWRARYRDDAGKEHARHFARNVDAQRWLDEVTASMVTGAYVDPAAGRVTFVAYFAGYARRQVWQSGTDAAVRLAAATVTFADVPLRALRRSQHLQPPVAVGRGQDARRRRGDDGRDAERCGLCADQRATVGL
jgi:hypothetical protein